MLKYSIAAAALVAAGSLAVADQMDRGDKGAGVNTNSAAEHAPGQMKGSETAKDFAPGQRKEEGSSAKEVSPGHLQDNAASHSEKGALDRKSENSESRKNKGAARNSKADKSDRNAKN